MALPSFLASMPRRNQLIVLFGAPALIAIALIFWCYKGLGTLGRIDRSIETDDHLPQWVQRDTPDSIWSQIQSHMTDIQTAQTKINEEPAIRRQLTSLKGKIQALEESLPKLSEKSETRDLLERLAREIPKEFGSVNIRSVNIVDSNTTHAAADQARTVTYQLDLIGDQGGIIKFIDSVEHNQRFMTINRLSIKSGGLAREERTNKIVFLPHAVSVEVETKIYNPDEKKAAAQ